MHVSRVTFSALFEIFNEEMPKKKNNKLLQSVRLHIETLINYINENFYLHACLFFCKEFVGPLIAKL